MRIQAVVVYSQGNYYGVQVRWRRLGVLWFSSWKTLGERGREGKTGWNLERAKELAEQATENGVVPDDWDTNGVNAIVEVYDE